MDFFTTAAQIGGVLIIAVAFELRLFAFRKGQDAASPQWIMPIVVVLSLVTLSAVAVPLSALAAGDDSATMRVWTALSLIAATAIVLIGGVVSWTTAALEQRPAGDSAGRGRIQRGESIAAGIISATAAAGVIAVFAAAG